MARSPPLRVRRLNRLEEIAGRIKLKTNRKVELVSADLSDAKDFPRVETLLAQQEDIDVLINNAGERIRFEVHDILASDTRAVIVGEVTSKLKFNGKILETAYAIILTVSGDKIVHFRMLEDSFAVSQVARAG